jgi:hypothetical protein
LNDFKYLFRPYNKKKSIATDIQPSSTLPALANLQVANGSPSVQAAGISTPSQLPKKRPYNKKPKVPNDASSASVLSIPTALASTSNQLTPNLLKKPR